MDLTNGDIIIISGEGDGEGSMEHYKGRRTARALRCKLTRERSRGDRWAHAWIDLGESYGKLSGDLEGIVEQRMLS